MSGMIRRGYKFFIFRSVRCALGSLGASFLRSTCKSGRLARHDFNYYERKLVALGIYLEEIRLIWAKA
jgi:hypothetical protein